MVVTLLAALVVLFLRTIHTHSGSESPGHGAKAVLTSTAVVRAGFLARVGNIPSGRCGLTWPLHASWSVLI